jgi:glucose-6-phosphate isomerase
MSGARSVPTRLAALAQSLSSVSLRAMFAADPRRAAALSRTLPLGDCELLADFSKQHVDAEVVDELLVAAREAGVFALRDRMLAGDAINLTEHRAVTHAAMRATSDATAPGNLRAAAEASLCEMRDCVRATPATITHVVNIGIGGSDLGPALLCDALAATRPPVREVRFGSNIDPLDLDRAVAGLDPQRTLFVVCSKSFGTQETMANARRAAAWLAAGRVADPRAHFIAVTARPGRVPVSGLPVGRVLSMPESVGGRYSVSSAVSVAVALGFGTEAFDDVRDGMRLVDEHFAGAAARDNVPLLLGLVWWWNSTLLGRGSVAVVPYSRALALLPAYLQQLVMESNGKSVGADGLPVATSTPVVWGGVGTNAQHAFFQMLHQGTQIVPCDFVGHSAALGSSRADHDVLVANMFAQSQALAFGVTESEAGGDAALRPHRATPGNRPSTTLLFSRLTPRAVGALIAAYEHATFVQGAMWGVNSFDQWGVELGKKLAAQVERAIAGESAPYGEGNGGIDASTAGLVERHRRWRESR